MKVRSGGTRFWFLGQIGVVLGSPSGFGWKAILDGIEDVL